MSSTLSSQQVFFLLLFLFYLVNVGLPTGTSHEILYSMDQFEIKIGQIQVIFTHHSYLCEIFKISQNIIAKRL